VLDSELWVADGATDNAPSLFLNVDGDDPFFIFVHGALDAPLADNVAGVTCYNVQVIGAWC
jgi:hypothetical protein